MTTALFGVVRWLGHELTVAAPHASWFEWLEDFTGLDVETGGAVCGRVPVLAIVDDRCVLVDGHDERRFQDCDALKAWLFLTVSDIMTSRGSVLALHAAGLVVDGRAVLIAGPPWSGKSTWAFEAARRGMPVLGDDQVAVEPLLGTVCAVPRPLKYRVVDERSARALSALAVRARLDGEDVALEPRRTCGLAAVDRAYAISRIVHLTRHAGPGVHGAVLSQRDAVRLVLDQLRGTPTFPSVGAATRLLSRRLNVRLSVGDGEIDRAFELALTIS
ncbi:MAG: hypothetical protein AB7Q29_04015 [Vicinamibacterales bacterium]